MSEEKIHCPHCRKEIDMEVPLGNNAWIKMLEERLALYESKEEFEEMLQTKDTNSK